jgi:hypothetical protein
MGAHTRLLARICDEVELALSNIITPSLTKASALLYHLLSASIRILMGTNPKRLIWLLEIVELTVRYILTSCVW